jgi:hypothetical protein
MKYLFLALGLLSFTARAQTADPVAGDWLIQADLQKQTSINHPAVATL